MAKNGKKDAWICVYKRRGATASLEMGHGFPGHHSLLLECTGMVKDDFMDMWAV